MRLTKWESTVKRDQLWSHPKRSYDSLVDVVDKIDGSVCEDVADTQQYTEYKKAYFLAIGLCLSRSRSANFRESYFLNLSDQFDSKWSSLLVGADDEGTPSSALSAPSPTTFASQEARTEFDSDVADTILMISELCTVVTGSVATAQLKKYISLKRRAQVFSVEEIELEDMATELKVSAGTGPGSTKQIERLVKGTKVFGVLMVLATITIAVYDCWKSSDPVEASLVKHTLTIGGGIAAGYLTGVAVQAGMDFFFPTVTASASASAIAGAVTWGIATAVTVTISALVALIVNAIWGIGPPSRIVAVLNPSILAGTQRNIVAQVCPSIVPRI